MLKTKILTIALGLSLSLFISCNKGSKVKTAELSDIVFEFEGPLFEGTNTAQYLYKVNLKELLNENISERNAIKSARLKSATVSMEDCEDCYGFETIKSLVLSVVSDGEIPMKEIALLNPVNAKNNTQTLNLSEESEIGDFFNSDKIYLILDADMTEEIDDNISMKGNFKIELRYD